MLDCNEEDKRQVHLFNRRACVDTGRLWAWPCLGDAGGANGGAVVDGDRGDLHRHWTTLELMAGVGILTVMVVAG